MKRKGSRNAYDSNKRIRRLKIEQSNGDTLSDNPIHDAERDEHRSAVRAMNELQRAEACGHTVCVNGVCYDCGEGPE